MGAATRVLTPSFLLLTLCLLPLFTLEHVQHLLSSLLFSNYLSTLIPPSTVGDKYETKTYTLSTNPLVIYITNFITLLEATQLVALSNDNFHPSPLYSDDGTLSHDSSYRSSLTATLPLSPIVKAVEARAKSFSFYNPNQEEKKIKPLVVQKYGLGKQYKDHYDWFLPHPSLTGNIESTFFVYISANCTGGGTNFPRLRLPSSHPPSTSAHIIPGGLENEWCEFIDCDRPYTDGVTFKPITGNAIFWENVDENGDGMVSTLHAGLPVTSGEKMGLNVWSWRDY
ncbi:uncharacterized protein PAC_14825 [Phialocephala subalpina]|uniref:Prolyl 4-hydroxylase alpha subunit domain-containing protein n=1 Tax=Phialocephala subalpina TaxID=576137 RepID=A0A1L7XIQ8_9HELO|nr:uncharacterized protein PAC_14825 [Phialocephala subalpina]